jgi:hypothetical protein
MWKRSQEKNSVDAQNKVVNVSKASTYCGAAAKRSKEKRLLVDAAFSMA